MDTDETEDSIEELRLERKAVFGKKKSTYPVDLMKGIIVNIRNREGDFLEEDMEKSSNVLIAMLEELLSGKSAAEKKRVLTDEYGMIMTAELEGRIQLMCNLSENIEAKGMKAGIKEGMKEGIKEGMKEGIKEGVRKERIAAIERMIKAGASKEQIISYGYTKEEYEVTENSMSV